MPGNGTKTPSEPFLFPSAWCPARKDERLSWGRKMAFPVIGAAAGKMPGIFSVFFSLLLLRYFL